MLINVKNGVFISVINDHFITVCGVVSMVFGDQGHIPWLTSAADGKHIEGSYHPVGLAWDFRTRGVSDAYTVADLIRKRLREVDSCYDVVYGDPQHRDHIHIEYDRRRAEKLRGKEG